MQNFGKPISCRQRLRNRSIVAVLLALTTSTTRVGYYDSHYRIPERKYTERDGAFHLTVPKAVSYKLQVEGSKIYFQSKYYSGRTVNFRDEVNNAIKACRNLLVWRIRDLSDTTAHLNIPLISFSR